MAPSQEVQDILDISRKALNLLKDLSQDPEMRKPQKKRDGSPVTLADLQVSHFLVQALRPLGYPVISEEELPEKAPGADGSYFLVDPLDGTKYFSRGEDEFAICVGLIKRGVPYAGVIGDPTGDQLYWAEKGLGAFQGGEPIAHPGVDGDLRVYSSGFHKRPERDVIISSLNIGEILEKGSALKFCDIAKGEVDLYMRFGPTSEWDTAAAQVLLQEAGCVLLEGKTLQTMTYGKPKYLNRGIVACHCSIKDKVVDFLKQHGPKPRNI